MGNKFRRNQQGEQCLQAANVSVDLEKNLEDSLLHHNYHEEEIVIEGEPVIVINNCSACFPDRRKRIPLTLVGNLKGISARKAVTLLEDAKFRFTKHWRNVARRLDVNLEVSSRCEHQISADNNYSTAMEECLDWWIQNDSSASWERLIDAVASYEPATGEEVRKSLGLYSTDVNDKMKRSCGEEVIIRLSLILQPRHSTILAPYLLSHQAAETVINKQPDESLKVLRMLQHWKDCWKEKATYEALVCVAKDALPFEPQIVEFVESLLDSTSPLLSIKKVCDFDHMNDEEKIDHKKAFRVLRDKFAKAFSKGAAFLIESSDISFIEVKCFISTFYPQQIEAENMEKLMGFVGSQISWFDYKMFESLMNAFGNDECKQSLVDYSDESSKYLNQSILNLPRNVSSSLQPAELRNLPKVYMKIPDNESEMPNLYGSDVKDIKEQIAEHIELSDSECINFISYRKGCIELVFSLVQKSKKPIPNTAWDEERQEHKITGDIVKLLPDSFRKRNRSLTSTLTAKAESMRKEEQENLTKSMV